jgi:hypothetical protein
MHSHWHLHRQLEYVLDQNDHDEADAVTLTCMLTDISARADIISVIQLDMLTQDAAASLAATLLSC